jgi:FixJ family two-component response regulator
VDDIPIIAIVDDDSMVAEATKGLVETFGFRACTFASGPEFLNSEALASTACLITDVQMPGMTGLQLYRRISRTGHHIPTIFITAFPDECARKQTLKAGAICYLNKPFDREELLNSIRSALGHGKGDPGA